MVLRRFLFPADLQWVLCRLRIRSLRLFLLRLFLPLHHHLFSEDERIGLPPSFLRKSHEKAR